jgi:hypothetical protein
VGVWAYVCVSQFGEFAVVDFEDGDPAGFTGDVEEIKFAVESEDIGAGFDRKDFFLLVSGEVEHNQFVIALAGM